MRRDPREVKLMPEYSVDLPLWPRSSDTDALVPPELLQRLIRWQEHFDASFHYERGWKNVEAKEQWSREAEALTISLREALPREVALTVDLWPLGTTTDAPS